MHTTQMIMLLLLLPPMHVRIVRNIPMTGSRNVIFQKPYLAWKYLSALQDLSANHNNSLMLLASKIIWVLLQNSCTAIIARAESWTWEPWTYVSHTVHFLSWTLLLHKTHADVSPCSKHMHHTELCSMNMFTNPILLSCWSLVLQFSLPPSPWSNLV